MLQMNSRINVADNSKIKKVRCINVLKGAQARYGRINDYILIAVSNKDYYKKYVTQTMNFGLLIGVCKFWRRFSGIYVSTCTNKIVLFDTRHSFIGSRTYGPYVRENYKINKNRIFVLKGSFY